MNEPIEQPTDKKAADIKPVISQSIRSLRLDVAITEFIHEQEQRGAKVVRMKTIVKQFPLISQTTLRNHIKSLVNRDVLVASDDFRGEYALSKGAYYSWVSDIKKYFEVIVGEDMFKVITERR